MNQQCSNGHPMSPTANYCETCGARSLPTDQSQPAYEDPEVTLPPPPAERSKRTRKNVGMASALAVLLAAIGITTYVFISDSSGGDADFAEIVLIVERFEADTEQYLDQYPIYWQNLYTYYDNFYDTYMAASSTYAEDQAVTTFNESVMTAQTRFENFASTYSSDVQSLKAELLAIQLDDATLRSLRDTTIEHFDSWRKMSDFDYGAYWEISSAYLADLSLGADQQAVDALLDEIFLGEAYEALSDQISDTFNHECSLLSDAQPADGSYRERIIDICDD